MLQLILRKILSKKWMAVSLLVGNILLISITGSCALYENAVLQKMLTSNLARYLEQNDILPGLTLMRGSVKTTSPIRDMENYRYLDEKCRTLADQLDVPEAYFVTKLYKSVPMLAEGETINAQEDQRAGLSVFSDIEDHITITNGRMYEPGVQEGNILEVIAPKRSFIYMNLMLGQTLRLQGVKNENGENYIVKVVGVFEPTDNQELYWYSSPSKWLKTLVMDEATFKELFVDIDAEQEPNFSVEWASVIDYKKFKGSKVDDMIKTVDAFKKDFDLKSSAGMVIRYYDTFKEYQTSAAKLKITLYVLQIPIFVLLMVFIFMVSGRMLDMEQKEIAILKSRGSSRQQILKLYLLQSLILAGAGLVIGIPLAFLICQIIGSANAFLEFVGRSALPVTMTWKALGFFLGAAILSTLTMVIPAFRYAQTTIVEHKQKKAGKKQSPLWKKLFLDVILLLGSLYIVYLYRENAEYISQTMSSGSALGPLMYLGSSIFILGAALVSLRLFPLLVRLIFRIGRKLWSPSLYASFLGIIRERSNQSFIMVFLIMTMSLGIFNAHAARAINENGESRIRYQGGSDLMVKEMWSTTAAFAGEEGDYVEPDFRKYAKIEGVESMTRVLRTTVSVTANEGKLNQVSLMAINTKEFGQTAWMKDGLLPTHWYNYLNAMSQDAEGVLVSSNMRDYLGLEVGQVIHYTSRFGSMRGVIYGFIDYWPTYAPTEQIEGRERLEDLFLIVSHFDQIQSKWGVFPYEVWIKMKDSTQPVYDWAAENEVRFTTFSDTKAKLIDWKNDPVTQGTNGVLTVGFIVILILCAVGFLIFWILSIRARELQFGIFRAMGMSMKEILGMLGNEQLFISGVSLALGALIGKLAAYLFVPMVQVAYTSADTVIPLEIADASADTLRLYIVIGLVVIVCMAVLVMLIRKIKISQALKLGED